MQLSLDPRPGESLGRTVERQVGEELSAWGYEVELRPPHSRGGDLLVWDRQGELTVIESRSVQTVQGAKDPFFDVEKGLRTQRDLAEKLGAARIVVVFAWIDPATLDTTVLAEAGELFEARARRNARDYMNQAGPRVENRRRPIMPMAAEDMREVEDILPSLIEEAA
ncbi:MAG: hypothetical protein ACTHZ9_13445 [Leucobacter sp.]